MMTSSCTTIGRSRSAVLTHNVGSSYFAKNGKTRKLFSHPQHQLISRGRPMTAVPGAQAGGQQGQDAMWEILDKSSTGAKQIGAENIQLIETPEAAPQLAASSPEPPGITAGPVVTDEGTPARTIGEAALHQIQDFASHLKDIVIAMSDSEEAGQASPSSSNPPFDSPDRISSLGGKVGDAVQGLSGAAKQAIAEARAGVDTTLFGQSLETLSLETGKLKGGDGLFDNSRFVEGLERAGVPQAVTDFLAKALDLEFSLADDGAPGIVALILVAFAATGTIVAFSGKDKDSELGDALPETYDPMISEAYFKQRPGLVVQRLLQLAYKSSGFLVGLNVDRRQGTWERNKQLRAQQCVELLTDLGPTFVKIGQALSIRVDLLPPEYILELKTLQDRVPPFPTEAAMEIMAAELTGGDVSRLSQLFSDLPTEPVASASLGQVYRCRVRNQNTDVAVKVQRPDVIEGIMLDLHLLRIVAPKAKKANDLNSDLVGLVDEWGTRFVNELDYLEEAKNGKRFTAAMEARGITAVTAAEVVDKLTTGRVLTTRWVDGTRLEESSEKDVSRLCGVALNAYLTMLLDTGVLHADPHPGNLLRTTDGRLCVLDWGLVTPISQEQQYALVDYIANLVSEDYGAIPTDLVSLGFVPPGREAALEEAGVVRVLSTVLRQLSSGGGAAKLNVEGLVSELQDMTQSYGNLFQIPPYFAYILRAFTVLEGIGLSSDPDYAIVQDENPRIRSALRRLVLTSDGDLDAESILRLTRNFQRFTASTQGLDQEQPNETGEAQRVDQELLSIVFADEPNFLQELLLEGAVKLTDALSREALARVLQSTTTGPVAAILEQQRAAALALGPLRPLLLPFPLPGELVAGAEPFARKNAEDDAQLELLERLLDAAETSLPAGDDQEAGRMQLLRTVVDALQRNAPLLPELAPGISATSMRFQAMLLSRAAERQNSPRLKEWADRLHAESLTPPTQPTVV